MIEITEMFTTTGAAQHYTVQGYPVKSWQIRRAYEKGLAAEPKLRMGRYRIISSVDLPALEKALAQLGYLPADLNTAA
jgi:hypothetical protein